MDYIIRRKETVEILRGKNWLLVYGRRKVGKTFLLRELCGFTQYYVVKIDRNIISPTGMITLEKMKEEVKALLKEDKTVVIDEFQRLDEAMLEELVQVHPHGRLILSGSSMRAIKIVFSRNSPLLGFFTPFKIGLISPHDILTGLHTLPSEKQVEMAAFLREPWLIPTYKQESSLEFLYEVITQSHYIISSLLGEIFSEEERELSAKYSTILSLIGAGTWETKQLTNLLYSRHIIPEPSTSHVLQYIKNLEEMDLIESIKMYKSKNKYFYRLHSPIMNLFYYLEDRYSLTTRESSLSELKPTMEKVLSLELQNFIGEIAAQKLSGRKEYFLTPSREIDFIITQRNKPIAIGEVKWKNIILTDLEHFDQSTLDFSCRKIIVGKKGVSSSNVEVWDSNKIVGK